MHRLLEVGQGRVGVTLLPKLRQGGVRQTVLQKGMIGSSRLPGGGGGKEVTMVALIRPSPFAAFCGHTVYEGQAG